MKFKIIRKQKFLRSFVFVLLIFIAALLPYPSLKTEAASCYGSTCTGYNPDTMGCGDSAYTATSGYFGDVIVEFRVSPTGDGNCDAGWERSQNISGSSMYAAGSTRYGCGNFCYHQSVSSPSQISNYMRVYTPMVGPSSTTSIRCCGHVSS